MSFNLIRGLKHATRYSDSLAKLSDLVCGHSEYNAQVWIGAGMSAGGPVEVDRGLVHQRISLALIMIRRL